MLELKLIIATTIYKSMSKSNKPAYSGRGGSREGSGRPLAWKHTPTTAIRVPESLKKQIMAFAHKLDEGAVQNQTGTNDELLILITSWQSKVEGKELQPRWSNVNKLLLELQSIITPPNDH
jgi:hypothetical protein